MFNDHRRSAGSTLTGPIPGPAAATSLVGGVLVDAATDVSGDDHGRLSAGGVLLAAPPAPADHRVHASPVATTRLSVLGGFALTVDGAAVGLPADARRLVAYLALHPRGHRRAQVAADLWPAVPAATAARLLDDAVRAVDVPGLLTVIPTPEDDSAGAGDTAGAATLTLGRVVRLDLAEAMGLIRTLPDVPALDAVDTTLLHDDLLPGWAGSWVAVERDRFRQLRLHALEERSRRLAAAGRHADAVTVAARAVTAAPSRGSARRALMEAHLSAGDVPAALAVQDAYEQLLRSSVGGPAAGSLDGLVPPDPAWPVLRVRRPAVRASVLPGHRRSVGTRRLVAGGTAR